MEIENYHPPKRSFIKDQPILSHEAFEKQMQIQKNKIAHLQTAEDENDKFPTKEDGLTLNSIQKAKGLTGQSTLHHYNPQFSSNLQNLKDNLEVKEKERLLENLIQKYKEEVIERKGVVNQNKYTKQVNNKIAYLKNDMEPILEHLRKNTKELTDYSFTSNILSNACSKLVCENSKELGEMIIGDILIEVVDILNENEVKKNNLEKNYKRKNVLDDFFEAMKGLQFDQDEILNRRCESWNNNKVREINTSEILIIDKKKYYNILEMTENFANKVLKDKLSIDSLMNEKNFSDKKFVSKTKQISESLVNEIIDEIYEEFEKAQNDFVEKIYEQEFFQK